MSRRVGVAAGILLLLVFVVAGLARISFNVDILKLLPTHLRQVEGLSLLLKHFTQADELIITLEAPTAETAEAEADAIAAALAAQPQLVKRAVARPPWEKNPGELAELLAYLVLNQPPAEIRALAARLSPAGAPAALEATRDLLTESLSPQEIALRGFDPFDLAGPLASAGLLGSAQQQQQSEFSSADGTFRVIYVEAARPFGNYKATIAWVKEIHRVLAPWHARPELRLGYTGDPAFAASIAGSMEWDMVSSGVITLVVIALIFWLCYRRWRPLLDLQGMLLLIFALTLASAGLFLHQLTVIGVGCAAIMIGLSVDYGYFIFQRSRSHGGSVRELQKQCAQYIAWTAGTTAAAFFALNLSSLPGLSQLGTLVGMGVVVGAVVMLVVFAPLTRRFHQRAGAVPTSPSLVENIVASAGFQRAGAWVTLVVVVVLLGTLAVKGWPGTDFTDRPLRPRQSEAYEALERMQDRLTDEHGLRSLVVRGGTVEETLVRLRAAEAQLAAAQTRGDVVRFRSALPLWPDAERQRENLPVLAPLAADLPSLREALRTAGFQDEAFALTEAVLKQWSAWSARAVPIWPDNAASRWIFRRAVGHTKDGQWLALGLVKPAPGHEPSVEAAVQNLDGVFLVSWSALGAELQRVIPREFRHIILALSLSVLALLALAFRSARAVGLFIATTALVFACLAGLMSLLGMTWNFFNLAAILLLLGTGTDYSILLLLALRRNGGDVPAAQRELGLVICLCACSAAAGFGTISWANHLGLASLGKTCALGLLLDAAISIFLLPLAWRMLHRRKSPGAEEI